MTGDGAKTGGVLILSAAAGAGHVRAAEALASAFAAKGIAAKHVGGKTSNTALSSARTCTCQGYKRGSGW